MTNETYKNYLIVPIFHYDNGKHDFEVYPDNGNEPGYMFHSTTREKVLAWIDSKVESDNLLNELHGR